MIIATPRRIGSFLTTVLLVVLFLTILTTLSGCGSTGVFRTLFTNVSSSDIEFTAVKSGEPVPLAGSVNSDLDRLIAVMNAFGADTTIADLLGVVLPVSVIGTNEKRFILCTDEYIAKARLIPMNAKITFSGQPVGPGLLWKPSRLTFEAK